MDQTTKHEGGLGGGLGGKLGIGQISDELLEKYNRPGPRYTSYPTAPVWKDDFGPADLEESYARADESGSPVSLYMHLPFCESLCLFCACNVSIQKDKSVAIPYLKALGREIDHVSGNGFAKAQREPVPLGRRDADVSFAGAAGGAFQTRAERFTFAPDAEIGIEIDPRVTTFAHLEALRRLGFNRLSMGIQDFEAQVQQTIHRVQPYEMTRDLIARARELGFESLNVDLIYGLPYQTAETFRRTIEQTLTLAPDRVAMFSYAHVPWLRKQQGALRRTCRKARTKFQIFRAGLEGCLDAGNVCIGMDHFARPGDELAVAQRNRTLHRNSQGYTTKAGCGSLRNGRERDQLDRRVVRAERARSARLSGGHRRARPGDDAGLSAFGGRPAAARGDRAAAVPHGDSQAGNRERVRDFVRRLFSRGTPPTGRACARRFCRAGRGGNPGNTTGAGFYS